MFRKKMNLTHFFVAFLIIMLLFLNFTSLLIIVTTNKGSVNETIQYIEGIPKESKKVIKIHSMTKVSLYTYVPLNRNFTFSLVDSELFSTNVTVLFEKNTKELNTSVYHFETFFKKACVLFFIINYLEEDPTKSYEDRQRITVSYSIEKTIEIRTTIKKQVLFSLFWIFTALVLEIIYYGKKRFIDENEQIENLLKSPTSELEKKIGHLENNSIIETNRDFTKKLGLVIRYYLNNISLLLFVVAFLLIFLISWYLIEIPFLTEVTTKKFSSDLIIRFLTLLSTDYSISIATFLVGMPFISLILLLPASSKTNIHFLTYPVSRSLHFLAIFVIIGLYSLLYDVIMFLIVIPFFIFILYNYSISFFSVIISFFIFIIFQLFITTIGLLVYGIHNSKITASIALTAIGFLFSYSPNDKLSKTFTPFISNYFLLFGDARYLQFSALCCITIIYMFLVLGLSCFAFEKQSLLIK